MIRLSAAVDLACWDIVGKAANFPLYKLFGGFSAESRVVFFGLFFYGKSMGNPRKQGKVEQIQGFRDEVPCYATCGYYREGKDEQELRDDLQMMVDQGHTGFKVKIGGLSLKDDA